MLLYVITVLATDLYPCDNVPVVAIKVMTELLTNNDYIGDIGDQFIS